MNAHNIPFHDKISFPKISPNICFLELLEDEFKSVMINEPSFTSH